VRCGDSGTKLPGVAAARPARGLPTLVLRRLAVRVQVWNHAPAMSTNKKKKKPRQKSKAALLTAETREERREERWAARAEEGEHPDRVSFRSRGDGEEFVKRVDTRSEEQVRKDSWRTGMMMLFIVGGATVLLIALFVLRDS